MGWHCTYTPISFAINMHFGVLTNERTTRDTAKQFSTVEIVIVKHLMKGPGARMLLMSRATASFGIVSARMPRSIATIPHRIAGGVCSGVRALICFPRPWLIAIEAQMHETRLST